MHEHRLHDRSVCPGCRLPVEGGQPVTYAHELVADKGAGRVMIRFHGDHFTGLVGSRRYRLIVAA